MKTQQQNPQAIQNHLYSLIVPKEMLESFEITNIEEKAEIITINLLEKIDKKPISEAELVQNGFMNSIDIQGFPIIGKSCYYRLTRRRWKAKGTSKDFYNSYSYTKDGSKTTPQFGAFLKEIGQ